MEEKKKRAIKNLTKIASANGKSSGEISKGMHTAFPAKANFTRNRVGDEVRSKKRGTSSGYMTGGKC